MSRGAEVWPRALPAALEREPVTHRAQLMTMTAMPGMRAKLAMTMMTTTTTMVTMVGMLSCVQRELEGPWIVQQARLLAR